MPDKPQPASPEPPKRRPTLADQLAAQHELLMAVMTKQNRGTSPTMEWGERATGDKAGLLYLKSAVFVQGDDEEDVQFLGRQFAMLEHADKARNDFNAGITKRQLEASVANPEPAAGATKGKP